MKRTNEEFKAEIFARSDKIIKRRKRINRVVMCCVPVLLCSFIGITALTMNGGIKANNERLDGSSDGMFDVNNNFSIFEECDTAAPEAVPELGGIKENGYSGSTSQGPVAVTVESSENEIVSHINDAVLASELDKLINEVVDGAIPCQKTTAGQYNISIHFGNNTVKNYSIAGNALICEEEIYYIDAALYDSILHIISDIIS
ncbi:MAG: hypothetical protein IKK26_05045 [Clostridia bacterium]|nr:hypothetical protein [Clostridia bacterium]